MKGKKFRFGSKLINFNFILGNMIKVNTVSYTGGAILYNWDLTKLGKALVTVAGVPFVKKLLKKVDRQQKGDVKRLWKNPLPVYDKTYVSSNVKVGDPSPQWVHDIINWFIK